MKEIRDWFFNKKGWLKLLAVLFVLVVYFTIVRPFDLGHLVDILAMAVIINMISGWVRKTSHK